MAVFKKEWQGSCGRYPDMAMQSSSASSAAVGSEPNYWIFKETPENLVTPGIRAGGIDEWKVSPDLKQVKSGDVAFLWLGGVYGWGIIVNEPDLEKNSVPVRYQVQFRPLIPISTIKEESKLAGLQILRDPKGTNFPVRPSEVPALNELIRRMGYIAPDQQITPSDDDNVQLAIRYAKSLAREAKEDSVHIEHLIIGAFDADQRIRGIFNEIQLSRADLVKHLSKLATHSIPLEYDRNYSGDERPSRHSRKALAYATEEAVFKSQKLLTIPDVFLGIERVTDCDVTKGLIKMDFFNVLRKEMEFELEPFRFPISGFGTDAVFSDQKREDCLNITDEVNALSSLIAARDLRPPLAIGLFGDWGTGKTFFMEQMRRRVTQIESKSQNSDKTSFCKNIVQITFNAWHYMDTNLWASLVTYIFEELTEDLVKRNKLPEEDARKTLFEKVESAKVMVKEAEGKKIEAEKKVKEKERKLEEKKSELNERQQNLTKLQAISVVQAALEDEVIQKTVDDAKNKLELETTASVPEIRQTVRTISDLWGKIAYLWNKAAKDKEGRLKRLLFLAVFVFFPFIFTVIVTYLLSKKSDLTALFGIITTLATAAAGLKPHIRKLSEVIDRWQHVETQLDLLEEEKRTEKSAEERRLQNELDTLASEQRVAAEQLTLAQSELSRAETELQEAAIGKRLFEFIRQRSTRTEYQQQLGIIALIRRDFDSLSKLLVESQKAEIVPGMARVDRIILYIDDLDRCPSSRVVEVLQAVHLLLAFPLFVVVVGVDSRWLLHALEEEYSAFADVKEGSALKGGNHPNPQWRTTPQNYIEKIFQIPFTLRPMDAPGYEKMIRHLLKDAVKERPVPPTPPASGDVGLPRKVEDQPESIPAPQESVQETVNPPLQPARRIEELDLLPPNLKVLPWEVFFMEKLNEMIPTARAANRLVNVYRLFKATIKKRKDLFCFEGSNEKGGEFQAAMLMLAIQIGFPAQAYDLFCSLAHSKSDKWWPFVESFRPKKGPSGIGNSAIDAMSEEQANAWTRLVDSLVAQKEYFKGDDSIEQFRKLVPRVARFSFLSVRGFQSLEQI